MSDPPPPAPIRDQRRGRVRLEPGRGIVSNDEPPAPRDEEPGAPEPKGSGLMGALSGVALLGGALLAYQSCSEPSDPPEETAAPSASAPVAVDVAPRCRPLDPGDSGFLVGEGPLRPVTPQASADPSAPVLEEPDMAPFAVVLGRAVAHADGFAVGALRDAEGGSVSSLVTLDAAGRAGKVVRLARSRGDAEAPSVAASGSGFVVATIEPNAGGRAVRLARVDGERVQWGAELPEGGDDSLALDVAAGASRALVVWDEADDERAFVSVSSFPIDDVGKATAPRRLTSKDVDADGPRVVTRKGGFWVAYVVHGAETRRERAADRGPTDPIDKDEADEARGGEAVAPSWVEVVQVDEAGARVAPPVEVTPRDGHVTGFDVAAASDERLLISWRDEDAPTGGGGGLVRLVRLGASGAPEPLVVAEEGTTDGAPGLLGAWLTVPSLRGADLLARLTPESTPAEPLEPEPSLGRGDPVAAWGDTLLVAEPDGRAMRLRVLRCEAARAPKPVEALP